MYAYETAASVAQRSGYATAAAEFNSRSFELARHVAAWYAEHTDLSDPNVWIVPDDGPNAGIGPAHVQANMDWMRALVAAAERALHAGDLDDAARDYSEALRILDESMESDPTLDPIYRRDLSDYAPLAGPILLRVGSREGYEKTQSTILSRLDDVAEEQARQGVNH